MSSKAQIFEALLSSQRALGITLAGGKVYFYIPGTTTLKTIYTTRAKTTPAANPCTLDANGQARIYGDGLYDVQVTDSTGSVSLPLWEDVFFYDGSENLTWINQYLSFSDAIISIGSTKTSLYIGSDQTLTSNITVPPTLEIVMVNGATIAKNGYSFKISNPKQAINISMFCTSGLGTIADPWTSPSGTAGLQEAWDSIQDNPTSYDTSYGPATIIVPPGSYSITSTPRFLRLSGSKLASFNLVGSGKGQTVFNVASGVTGLQVWGDIAPDRRWVMMDWTIQGISFIGADYTGVGLDIYDSQKFNILDVRASGFNYGLKLRSSWNFTISERSQFSGNNVGVKVPDYSTASDVNKNEGVNAADIKGCSIANNVKAGLSFNQANVLTLSDTLMESNPVAMYFKEQGDHITIGGIYYELGSETLTETDKNGTLTGYLLITGKDEDGDAGDTARPITQLKIGNMRHDAANGKYWLQNVNEVWMDDLEAKRAYIRLGANVVGLRSNAVSADPLYTDLIIPGVARNVGKKIHRLMPFNFIPNGDLSLSGTPYLSYGSGSSGNRTTYILADSSVVPILDVTLPGGQTSVTVSAYVQIPSGADYGLSNRNIQAALHAFGASADIASVSLQIYTNGGQSVITTKSSGLTSWFALNNNSNINVNLSEVTYIRYDIIITRTTGTGDAHLYINQMLLADAEAGQIIPQAGQGLITGLSRSVTCSTSEGSGWYSATINTGYTSENYFNAIASPRYAAISAVNTLTQKLTGGSAGQLKIWASANGAVVDVFILPLVTILP